MAAGLSQQSELRGGDESCGREYAVAVLNKCVQGGGAARWGHGVTQSEGAPADKRLGGSARPAPPAQGVTAEYTWPGSFRPSRDNWERLSPRPQPKLTKGIMCGGRSEQSKVKRLKAAHRKEKRENSDSSKSICAEEQTLSTLFCVEDEAREGAVLVVVAAMGFASVQFDVNLVPCVQMEDDAVGGIVIVLVSILGDGAGTNLEEQGQTNM
ncbi:hypothetical protein L3Q82_013956 [Scortum barcoo]|uniref:Uncharacterized protein n=1 Tax=Scortum barcoo TaxID=214431 RepID=A0ACB8VVP6_9TELE|nr:hypothetical protein L3Q82_013956 [Scortum barcoo]